MYFEELGHWPPTPSFIVNWSDSATKIWKMYIISKLYKKAHGFHSARPTATNNLIQRFLTDIVLHKSHELGTCASYQTEDNKLELETQYCDDTWQHRQLFWGME